METDPPISWFRSRRVRGDAMRCDAMRFDPIRLDDCLSDAIWELWNSKTHQGHKKLIDLIEEDYSIPSSRPQITAATSRVPQPNGEGEFG